MSNFGRLSRIDPNGVAVVYHCPDTSPLCVLHGYFNARVDGRSTSVHRIVSEAFHGPCPDDCVVHHVDRNLLNNHEDNLIFRSKKHQIRKRKAETEEPTE